MRKGDLNMPPLIAVVDDDVSVRKSLDRLIRSDFLEVKAFASAEEFLISSGVRQPDCLILDVRLPGMNGIELHRHLRCRRAQTSTIPVIFITAHASDELARLKAGSNAPVAFFIKPFSGDELLDAVNAALRRTSGD
jgi:FixJ family two-component response regulator